MWETMRQYKIKIVPQSKSLLSKMEGYRFCRLCDKSLQRGVYCKYCKVKLVVKYKLYVSDSHSAKKSHFDVIDELLSFGTRKNFTIWFKNKRWLKRIQNWHSIALSVTLEKYSVISMQASVRFLEEKLETDTMDREIKLISFQKNATTAEKLQEK